jgi:hypothetical protein
MSTEWLSCEIYTMQLFFSLISFLREGPMCVCVPFNGERWLGFSQNLVRMLCHWRSPQHRMYVSNFLQSNNMADAQTCEVGATHNTGS